MFKKLLITMLVVMAASSAMAGDMDWKFYGKLHTSIDMLNTGEDSQMWLSSNTSRFGFKGGTELNENFTFIWQFESSLNMTQKGEETLATRNSYVGVKGDWGKVIGGIHDTPFKILGRKVDFFKDELGDFRHATMGWDRRLQEVLAYATPDMGGFVAMLAYQFDQGHEMKYFGIDQYESATAFSGMAAYNKDKFFVGVGYESLSKGYDPFYDADDELESQSGIRVAGKYDAEAFAVSALYQTLSNYGGVKDWSSNTFGLEALFRFAEGKWAAKGSYFMTNPFTDAEDDDATPDFDESDVNASFLALGIDHNVTDTVKFYLQYVMAMNGENSGAGVGGSAMGIDDDGDIIRGFANGHGSWAPAAYNEDGEVQNPSGFSFGTIIKF